MRLVADTKGIVTLDDLSRMKPSALQFSDVFDQIVAYAAGRPINVVNPAVLEQLKRQ